MRSTHKYFALACLGALQIFLACSQPKTGTFEAGMALHQQGKYAEAIEQFQQATQAEPRNAEIYNMLGMAYRFRFNQTSDQQFREQEITAFKKAVEIDEQFWIAHKNLAVTLYSAGKKVEAAPHIKRALELQPNDPERPILQAWLNEAQKL